MLKNKVLSLSDLTYEILVKFIWQWKPIGPDLAASTKKMNNYIQCLSVEFIRELYRRFLSSAKDDNKHYIQAWHIALFLFHGQTELKLKFENRSFDFQFLLDVSGSKMLLIDSLELPGRSSLPATLCQSMCSLLPCITKLDLHGISIGDDAMPFLATLALKELNLVDTDVLDDGLMELCLPTSRARLTLLDLRIEERNSISTCCHLMTSIIQLEYLSYNNCKLLTSLPESMMKMQLNLKKLDCEGPAERIARALTVAVNICPDVNSIYMNSREFTPEILHGLTKFKKLVTLTLSNHLIVINYDDLSVYFKNFVLCSLRNLSIHRVDVNWFLSGHCLNTLLMCPHLETLALSYCGGFDDQIASNMAILLTNGKLRRIRLKSCNLIGPKAICCMLHIPSLYELYISMAIPSQRAKEFDVAKLKHLANLKNVNLRLSIYCYFREHSGDS